MKRFWLSLKIPKQSTWYNFGRYKTFHGAESALNDAFTKTNAMMGRITDCWDNSTSYFARKPE